MLRATAFRAVSRGRHLDPGMERDLGGIRVMALGARTPRAEAKAPFPNEWGGARAQASSDTTAERQLRSIH